jgi:RHS repeat-associated protein
MDQVGNWEHVKLDLDGDGSYGGTDEYDDDRTHNEVNELTGRDTDDNGSDDHTLVYDEAGNLTDDGERYKYEYDVWYRLRKAHNQSDALLAEHRYNGLGHRIAEHADTDVDGDVDANDDWHHFAYDERWRVAAMFLDADTSPTGEFVPQNAGAGGQGGASYIDEVVLRDRDTDGNGSLDERVWYCQNRRYDVIALVDDGGDQREMVRYSAYGVPFGLVGGDADSDGDCDVADSTDTDQIQSWINASTYDVRGDLNLDGLVDAADKSLGLAAPYSGASGGLNATSLVGNQVGAFGGLALVRGLVDFRRRVLDERIGRWTRRDPLGYLDGPSLYAFVGGHVYSSTDPFGTYRISANQEQAPPNCTAAKADHPWFEFSTRVPGLTFRVKPDTITLVDGMNSKCLTAEQMELYNIHNDDFYLGGGELPIVPDRPCQLSVKIDVVCKPNDYMPPGQFAAGCGVFYGGGGLIGGVPPGTQWIPIGISTFILTVGPIKCGEVGEQTLSVFANTRVAHGIPPAYEVTVKGKCVNCREL